jgi:ketosteroid isomerase-like protein
MTRRSALDVVRRFETAFEGGQGDIDAVLRLLDPDIVIHEAASLPYAGEHRGRAGFLALTQAFAAAWEFPWPKRFEFLDTAAEHIVVLTTSQVRSRATGRVADWRLSEHF